jgi:tRNA(Ile)-lysidine synthase
MYALRGSGLAGLSGLRALQGNIIRPILGYTRPEIESYAVANKITWFEDDSNETDDYTRNRIRHHILPALPLVDERWAQGLQTTQNNVEVSLGLLRETVELWKNNNVVVINDEWHLSLAALAKIENRETLIHFLMADVDASLPANALANCINDAVGSKYIGHTHEALRDRENLIIRKKLTPEFSISTIDENTSRINFPVDISFEIKSINDFTLGQIPQTEAFDFDKLTFPLVIRQWQQGDKFRPLGMSGMKKVSDYLTDAKMNRFNKENTFVLTSAGEIVWLIGLRIDDRYKVETTTRLLYLARLEKPLL